jgi:hypothetical protein
MNKSKSIIVLVVLAFIGLIAFNLASYSNKETFSTKVLEKERVMERSGKRFKSYYLIYTENGTYKLEDELLYGNFRSSDWYGKIKVDSTYEFTTIGFRVGILSEYPNIVEFNK